MAPLARLSWSAISRSRSGFTRVATISKVKTPIEPRHRSTKSAACAYGEKLVKLMNPVGHLKGSGTIRTRTSNNIPDRFARHFRPEVVAIGQESPIAPGEYCPTMDEHGQGSDLDMTLPCNSQASELIKCAKCISFKRINRPCQQFSQQWSAGFSATPNKNAVWLKTALVRTFGMCSESRADSVRDRQV